MSIVYAYVVDVSTKEILRIVQVPEEQLDVQFEAGEAVLPAAAPFRTPYTHYIEPLMAGSEVVGYQLYPYTGPQAAAKAVRPEYPAHWDNNTMSWVDDRVLDKAKLVKIRDLGELVETLKLTGSFMWDSDEWEGRVDIDPTWALISYALSDSQSFSATKKNGTTRTLTALQVMNLYKARALFYAALSSALVTKTAAVNAATTISAIDAITLGVTQPYP